MRRGTPKTIWLRTAHGMATTYATTIRVRGARERWRSFLTSLRITSMIIKATGRYNAVGRVRIEMPVKSPTRA